MSEFEKLLAELNATAEQSSTLAKSLPADDGEDDKAIQAAAADGADANNDDQDKNPEDADGVSDGDNDDTMAKSMVIDGEEVKVIDGDEILKSLGDLGGRLTTHEQMLVKALEATNGALKQQNDLIKSLSEQVATLSNQGRGRKTVLAVHEKKDPVTLAKSDAPTITGHEIMAKALDAQKSGKLSGLDVSRIENHLNAGLGVPADVLAKLN